jgi:hypothetical protein
VTSTAGTRSWTSADSIAGFCATLAIFLAGLELFYRPFRLAPVAVLLAVIATAMDSEGQRLIPVAWASIGICFIVGATLQLLTHHPLY